MFRCSSINLSTFEMLPQCPPVSLLIGVMFSLDIDECSLGTHTCSQNCQDTQGSFTCSCNSGFELDVDGRTCNGKHANIGSWNVDSAFKDDILANLNAITNNSSAVYKALRSQWRI